MTGVSHVTTGVVITLAIPHPALALPLAFLSHFVLDRLPHWGDDTLNGSHVFFRRVILLDTVLGIAFIAAMILWVPSQWPLILLGSALATLPDLMWLPNFIREARNGQAKPHNRLMLWHKKIQFERNWGVVTEAAWLLTMVTLLVHII